MRGHRFGYALYEPVPFERLYPGMLGFLDEYQRWHPILDLNDKEKVQAEGYFPLGYTQRADPKMRRYLPLTASSVLTTDIALRVNCDATAPSPPLDVSGVISYSTGGDFGAILVCDTEVVAEGFDFRDPFKVWLQRNAKLLFSKYPDAEKHGLCVATWTYSTTDIHISTWEGAGNSVTVGCTASAMDIGPVGPQTTWFRGHASSGWSSYTDQKRVTFFAGVKIEKGPFGPLEKSEKSCCRCSNRFMVESEDEPNGYYLARFELFGDNWYDIQDDLTPTRFRPNRVR
ncbi:hypothetical protein O1611_g356 [Lasiodiplodia mahajangana]|uniref:Uncharacterized protein n=1 Tax=Lasiodiplodia mahajangana TaxID=1108764 RepID=A0ACC2K0S1_9PEZI|nr:hypothetical protein O1611_g356 [Lasiodiplodia mahajangana]